ncbi:hypothetical protein KHA93_17540 [Bacillus sp. FJAT-49732]|uniref:Uncharacterized protein n=1 Tax=Lederbergia citrisecunda TaxID=2833583 RepID=A0A942TND2_9BACI|nr:hypothetical protein [Lederbergia citrisecunda]MBS4201435.1 hypothetical protein [Lederbergia citrisecunda]
MRIERAQMTMRFAGHHDPHPEHASPCRAGRCQATKDIISGCLFFYLKGIDDLNITDLNPKSSIIG